MPRNRWVIAPYGAWCPNFGVRGKKHMKRLGRVRRLLAVLLLAVSVLLVSGCDTVEICRETASSKTCIRGKFLAEQPTGYYANLLPDYGTP